MITHGFDMHRVFISAPGDLAAERDSCRQVISSTNEKEAMPRRILLVSVGLTNDDSITSFRSVVSENVRQCAFFIQIFQDDWGPKNLFRKMFFLATECRDDPALPMQDVIVCLKDAPNETDPEILAFRKELEERKDVKLIRFDKPDTLKGQLREVCSAWAASIPTPNIDQPTSGAGLHSM